MAVQTDIEAAVSDYSYFIYFICPEEEREGNSPIHGHYPALKEETGCGFGVK